MKIILEGCEGTGKTTLAKLLCDKYNLDYIHITNNDPNDYEFYKQTMRKENAIYDRHFIGEMIYPYIYNRKGNMNHNKMKLLKEFANKENVKILILTADIDIIKERIKNRNKFKPNFILNELPKIWLKFMELGYQYNFKIIDTSKISFNDICKELEK